MLCSLIIVLALLFVMTFLAYNWYPRDMTLVTVVASGILAIILLMFWAFTVKYYSWIKPAVVPMKPGKMDHGHIGPFKQAVVEDR